MADEGARRNMRREGFLDMFVGAAPHEQQIGVNDEDLIELISTLNKLINFAVKIDRLPSVTTLPFGDRRAAIDQTEHLFDEMVELLLYADTSIPYMEYFLVKRLRDLLISWKEIGKLLGINAPGAQKRWGARLKLESGL